MKASFLLLSLFGGVGVADEGIGIERNLSVSFSFALPYLSVLFPFLGGGCSCEDRGEQRKTSKPDDSIIALERKKN
jgi:hypothetical protein